WDRAPKRLEAFFFRRPTDDRRHAGPESLRDDGRAELCVMTAQSYSRIVGANERVRVGVVGFADRSRESLLPAFQISAEELNFEIVALSDIWNRRRDEGAAFLKELTGTVPAVARNNDELYDMKDVDATIIATADFQHALHAAEAVRAGRHAFVE